MQRLANCYDGIAEIYNENGEYEKCKEVFEKCMELWKENKYK